MADKLLLFFLVCCVIDVTSGTYCTEYDSGSSIYSDPLYCPYDCCGNMYNRYCCGGSNVGLILGVILGVGGLITTVTIVVVVCCCCRRSRGQQGQVHQPVGVLTTARVYGVQTTAVASPAQIGYTNAAFPQQLHAGNVAGNGGQRWQSPPPHTVVNTS